MQSGRWLLPACYVEVMQICWLLGTEIPRKAEILQNLWTSTKDHKMTSVEREMKERGFHWLNPQWKCKICRLIKTLLKIYFLSISTYKKWNTAEETGWKVLHLPLGEKCFFLFFDQFITQLQEAPLTENTMWTVPMLLEADWLDSIVSSRRLFGSTLLTTSPKWLQITLLFILNKLPKNSKGHNFKFYKELSCGNRKLIFLASGFRGKFLEA